MSTFKRIPSLLGLIALLLIAAGCGPTAKPGADAIKGKVSYNGKPVQFGVVMLVAPKDRQKGEPAFHAGVISNGEYTVLSKAPLGTYGVAVTDNRSYALKYWALAHGEMKAPSGPPAGGAPKGLKGLLDSGMVPEADIDKMPPEIQNKFKAQSGAKATEAVIPIKYLDPATAKLPEITITKGENSHDITLKD